MRVLVTEMAGRASLELKGRELGVDLAGRPAALTSAMRRVKELEARGWSFEAADASLELLLRDELSEVDSSPFVLESYRVILDHRVDGEVVSEATVKVQVAGQRVIATAEGNGPVHALDAALRRALLPHLSWLDEVQLTDYKVRILTDRGTDQPGTDAVTRVLVESTDHEREWTTVGVHGNIVEASWLALCDALAHKAMRVRSASRVG
jgi:2-isopropylmalate synthase